MQFSEVEAQWAFYVVTLLILVLVGGLVSSFLFGQQQRLKMHQEKMEELLASEKKYRNLFENSLVGMVRVSLEDGTILDTNAAFLQMLGVENRSGLGPLFQHFPPGAYEMLRSTIIDKGIVDGLQLSFAAPSGELRWLLFSGRRSDDGMYVEGVVEDITSRVVAQEKMVRAQQLEAIGILAGGMAHDLRNIFNPMQMLIESIRSKGLAESQSKRLGLIEEGVALGMNLIEKVLGFAKGASSTKGKLSVSKLVSRLETLLDQIRSESLRVLISLPEDLPPILADESQAYQVLYNLILNAREAMPEGGELRIIVDQESVGKENVSSGHNLSTGSYVRIQVHDTGTGIPKETLKKIWEPFHSTKGSKGTGLGLATVSNIMFNHDGAVTVESQVGKGSVFTVFFPLFKNSTARV
jgi:PAS domain S-box-containing protein